MNFLNRLKKIELIAMVNNLQEERDILFDETQSLREEINDVETYETEAQELDELKDLIGLLKIAKERDFLGVATAREDYENTLDKIMGYV